MSDNVNLGCACGAVTGILREPGPRVGSHIVCHCQDCQRFARILDADHRVLGPYGGTALYQGRCGALRLLSGRERLKCLHLTERPTLRWYAMCCRTPMFNTYANGRVPYISVLLANGDPDQIRRLIGHPIGHLFLPADTSRDPDLVPLSPRQLIRPMLVRMAKDLLSGDRHRAELFDPANLRPIAKPERVGSNASLSRG